MDKNNFFISIGPEKTGTSWLYNSLKQHPKLELPKVKEIKYFWAKEYLSNNNALTNLFGKHWHYRGIRRKSIPKIKYSIKQLLKGKRIDTFTLFWYLKYLLLTQNDKWYESLFPKNKLSGDITPKYCELSEESISNIKTIIPNCKIIISLRDPVDRHWSWLRMVLLKNQNRKNIAEVDEMTVLYYLKNSTQNKSNDYSRLIEKWGKFFDNEKIMIFYYEELLDNPQLLFDKICRFLDIETLELENVNDIVNPGVKNEISKKYQNILVNSNYEFIKKFSSNYPNKYSLGWLEKYKTEHKISKRN